MNNFVAEEGAAFFVVGVYLNYNVNLRSIMILKKRVSEKIVKEGGLALIKTYFQANISQQTVHSKNTLQDHCLDIGSSYC